MIPEEKAELAGLLEEKMLRRERWPKIKLRAGKAKLINGVEHTCYRRGSSGSGHRTSWRRWRDR